jgi:hypothetical protein
MRTQFPAYVGSNESLKALTNTELERQQQQQQQQQQLVLDQQGIIIDKNIANLHRV